MSVPRVDSASTATRLLRLVLPAHEAPGRVLTHRNLMDESERLLCAAAHCGQPIEELVASRILDNPHDYHCWENEHASIMRPIAMERSGEMQKCALLSASLALVHRKALFEYMRDREVRGTDRRRLMAHFFSRSDYSRALISEHGNYLRSAASYLCSSHLGRQLLLDEIFDEPLQQYEKLYGDYFRAYCDCALLADSDSQTSYMQPLLIPLKQQVNEWREALQALAHSRSGTWRRPNFSAPRDAAS
jgi:hypothetical protein